MEGPKGLLALGGVWATWIITKFELATTLLLAVDLLNLKILFEIASFGAAAVASLFMGGYYFMKILFPKKYKNE
jgi:hypothetical protein